MTKKKARIVNSGAPINAAIAEIQSDIDAIRGNPSPYEEKNFDERIEVIDFIEFQIIGQLEALLQKAAKPDHLVLLKNRAEKVKAGLEAIDTNLFKKLHANIRTGAFKARGFKNLVNEYVSFNLADNKHQEAEGYDNLDIFINGLFPFWAMPEQTKDLEPEMVFYQKTPARTVFELAEKVHFVPGDVFFDLGSGLGQVAILVNLLIGIKAIGVEFEPAFCDYANRCAAELNLPGVTFINLDARKAAYAIGTVFFMYTPFKGTMLQEVLAIIQKESLCRKIKVITYGPCTAEVALQSWLDLAVPNDGNIYKLAVFNSL